MKIVWMEEAVQMFPDGFSRLDAIPDEPEISDEESYGMAHETEVYYEG